MILMLILLEMCNYYIVLLFLSGSELTKMEEWTEEDVESWLRAVVQFPERLVKNFEGVDGYTLVRLQKEELKEDFELRIGHCKRLMFRREDQLGKESTTANVTADTQLLHVEPTTETAVHHGVSSPVTTRPDIPMIVKRTLVMHRDDLTPTSYLHMEDREAKNTKIMEGSSTALSKSRSPSPEEHVCKADDSPDGVRPQIQDPLSSSITEMPSSTELPLLKSAVDSQPRDDFTFGDKDIETNADNEKKLANLLLGSDKGTMDSSYYPVLVVNTPSTKCDTVQEVEEKFGFVSSVKWNVAFDCDVNSYKDGLCKHVHDNRPIKILSPGEFADTKDVNIVREDIDFPEVPVWIFPNGRDDAGRKEQKLSDIDWMRERSNAVLDSVRFFSNPSVIPPGRAVVIFLLLSDADVMVISHIFRELYTSKSFKDLRHFTVIAEDQAILEKWVKHIDDQKIVAEKDLTTRCLSGIPWQKVNMYMLRLLGSCQTRLPELPMYPTGSCQLPKKHQSQWSDLTILAKNECENTTMDESNPNFLDHVHEMEANFYRGHEVNWWNFYLSERKLNGGIGYDQVLERDSFKALRSKAQRELGPQKKKGNHISMVSVFHEAGSGGTTVAKNVLWDLHRTYRCAVVNRITNDTVKQIMAFRKEGYEPSKTPGPVVILLENQDSESMRPFLTQLEQETRYLKDNGLSFLLLHCKRTNEPEKLQKMDKNQPCVAVQHKLSDQEIDWFRRKTEDLEQRNVFSEKDSPERLLAFMVMKNQCDPAYLQNVVQRVLPNVTEESAKEIQNGVKLIKYIAAVHLYNPDFAMPVSACDGFMQKHVRISCARRTVQTYEVWEKTKPKFMDLFLNEEFIKDIDGCVKGLKMVHMSVAKEVVFQLGEHFKQTQADMILELMDKSTILDTLSHSKGYIQKVCRNLIVRRLKREYGDDTETNFSPLIEDVYLEDKRKAFRIMELGVQKFKDPFIAQHKARLHSKYEDDSEGAEEAIGIALGLLSNNSYLWDTKGNILRQKMMKYEHKEAAERMTDSEMQSLLEVFYDACAAFQKAQEVMEEETTGQNYAGFVGEIFTIFKLLEIVQKRVWPFCSGRSGEDQLKKYLMTDFIPHDLKLQTLRDHHEAMKELNDRVEFALGRFVDYLIQCGQQRFGSANYQINDVKLEKIYRGRSRFFVLPSVPQVDATLSVKTVYAWRRSEVRRKNADGYQQIFELASQKRVDDLKEVRGLLRQNLESPELFDVKNYVFVSFALSVCSDETLDVEDMKTLVHILKEMEERTGGFYGLFFEMLLNWPEQSSRDGSKSMTQTIQELRYRWKNLYSKRHNRDITQNLPKRSKIRQQVREVRAATEFYLGHPQGGSRFVHRHALGRVTYATWKEDATKTLLARLEGTLDNKHFVLYSPPGADPVKISLSLPLGGLPSQEPVQFYLGFSFAGPLAYDVSYKDNRETRFIAREAVSSYPAYVNDIETGEGIAV